MLISCVKLDHVLYSINYGSTCALLVAELGLISHGLLMYNFLAM